MCKFHKDVAMSVATSPVTGQFDTVCYSLTLCALAKFWVNKYMPDMGHLDGYSPYELSSDAAQKSFAESGLGQEGDEIPDGLHDRIRNMIGDYITRHPVNHKSLNLPQAPHHNPRFLDVVTMSIYEGEVADGLTVKSSVDNARHEPLRAAIEGLYKEAGFAEMIEAALKESICALFADAPRQVNPQLLSVYNRLPTGLRTAFGSCSLHGGGGALAHVVVCGTLNMGIGGFSGAFLNAAMYGIAPAVAMGTTYVVEKYRMNDFNPYKYILPMALSLGAAFGAARFLPHEHSTDPRMQWFYGFTPVQRHQQLQVDYQRYLRLPQQLRDEVDKEASRQKMTVAMFMTSLEVCGGDLTPQIKAFEEKSTKNAAIPRTAKQELH